MGDRKMRNSRGGELNYRTQNIDRRSLELNQGEGGSEGAAVGGGGVGGGGGEGGGAVAVGEVAEGEEGPGEVLRTESDWERIHLVKKLRQDLDMR